MPVQFSPELFLILPPLAGEYAAIAFPALAGVIAYQDRRARADLERERASAKTLFDALAATTTSSSALLDVTKENTATIKRQAELIEKQNALIDRLYNASNDTSLFARAAIEEFRRGMGDAHSDHRAIIEALGRLETRREAS